MRSKAEWFQFHVANFFRLIHTNLSVTQFATRAYVVCITYGVFSFTSLNTRSMRFAYAVSNFQCPLQGQVRKYPF